MYETSTQLGDTNATGFASATSLVSRVDELQRGRDQLERAWKINLSFYKENNTSSIISVLVASKP